MKDENEVLHTTKEVINLDELTESAINSIEQIVDENMVEADLQFQEEIEQLHVPEDTMILEPDTKDKKTKKENIFKKLKDKWQKLSKKKKIIIIVVSIIVLILIGVGLFFLLSRKPESLAPEVPDVIILEDNYRYENGVLHFLDDEEEIGTYECNNKDENKCFVAYLTNDDEFDGLKQINNNDDEINVRSKIYNNRFVFVFDNKSENDEIVKLYDIKENEVKEEFLQVKAYDFIEDAVILKNMDSKYGLVTFTSEEVKETIPYQYDKLGILSDDKNLERLVAKKDGSFYLINQNNEVLTNAMAEMIVGANKKHLKTKNANVYTVFDYQGKEVGKGDYALLLDDYVIFARDMQLFVTDYEKHPMNLDGIAIKNNTYNPIATYKNNKLVKTEKSFDAQVYDKNLILTIYDDSIDDLETVTLNLLDGLYSANLAFMNYLNGKLYFYSDEKKENLLGSYVCSNKNSIDSVNATLKNCTIASESFLAQVNGNEKEENKANDLGLLPVFYNRYIFIRDGNDAIVLYDLKESSTKAWYTKVDAKIYNKADKLSTVDKGPYYYIAESERSGNYGLAKITANSVEVQLEFKYNSLYRLGDYYVVQTDSDY